MSTATTRKPNDFKSDLKPIWCPGCGDFGVLASLYRAFAHLDLDPAKTVVVSGIVLSSIVHQDKAPRPPGGDRSVAVCSAFEGRGDGVDG